MAALLAIYPATGANREAAESAASPKCDEARLERAVRPLELVSILKSLPPRLGVETEEYGSETLAKAARDAVTAYAGALTEGGPNQVGPEQQARVQAALTIVAGELDRSRSRYNRLLGRSYRPRLTRPPVLDPGEVDRQAELAFSLIRHLDGTDIPACQAAESELRDAAYAALIAGGRDLAALGADDPLRHVRAAGLAAPPEDGTCGSTRQCVLRARLELLRSETVRGEAAARHVRDARAHALAAIGRAAEEGPNLGAAEAWMVLAELEPVVVEGGGQELNPGHVRNAYAMVERLGAVGAREGSFRHRLLPIYQAAADAAYLRTAGESLSHRTLALLEVGEAARRAQIEYVLADACEPVKVPLSPAHLRADETIVYPVIGQQRAYLLLGTRPDGQAVGVRDPGAGWQLRVRSLDGGPAPVADSADRLVASLQRVTEEDARRHSTKDYYDPDLPLDRPRRGPAPLEWRDEDARSLNRLVLEPLTALLPEPAATSSKDAPTLIFFPDPLLRNVPWALLHDARADGSRTAYLVQSYAIAVGPALAYVRPSERPAHRGHLVAGGYDVAREGLEAFVRDLPDVVANLPSYDLIVRPSAAAEASKQAGFTRDALLGRMRAGDVSVLLLATHAKFEGAASSIIVAPQGTALYDELPLDEIESSLRAGRRRARILDLLILVACQGATGDAGELGLAGAALRGGAAGTIGSVVRVSSKAAPRYFADAGRPAFLPAYYEGDSPAQSLRTAQLAAMASGDHEVMSVGFEANWGTFLLIGNWR